MSDTLIGASLDELEESAPGASAEGWWDSRCFSGRLHVRWARERNFFCACRAAGTSRTAGTKRSCGERCGEVAGGARGRAGCAKKKTHRSLLRGQTARPLGRVNTLPAPFARRGRRGRLGRTGAAGSGVDWYSSWKSERARHVREGGSALFSASRAGGNSLGASERHYSASRAAGTRSSASMKQSCGERRGEGAGGASGRKRRRASSRVIHDAKGNTRTRE